MLERSGRGHAALLWALLLLFVLRVAGQILVAVFDVSFLPPMEEWYSGLIPYGPLLASQIAIIVLAVKICLDVTRGDGFFGIRRPRLGLGVLAFGLVYLLAMLIRYVVRMSLHPEERWTGGAIPIVFHWVLAAFLVVLGARLRGGWAEGTGEASR